MEQIHFRRLKYIIIIPAFYYKQIITLSKKWRAKLIAIASLFIYPSIPVFPILSEPAKSTKCNLLTVLTSLPIFCVSIYTMKIQWERVEASFIGVSATT